MKIDILCKVKNQLEEGTSLPYFFDVINYENINNQELKDHLNMYGKTLYQKQKSKSRIGEET